MTTPQMPRLRRPADAGILPEEERIARPRKGEGLLSERVVFRPDHDPLWAAAHDLGVPIGIHPVAEPPERRVYQRFLS